MELISVIIPTYNGADFLAQALSSVAAQSDDFLEVIVSDDGSSDETLDIAQSFKDRLALEIKCLPRVGNWAKNSNRGVLAARGKFISFLHQDDFWDPQRLNALRQAMNVDKDASVFVHPSRYVSSGGRSLGVINCPFGRQGRLDGQQVFERLLVQNFIMMPAPLISRSAFWDAGGFDPKLWYTADWKLWLELSRRCAWHYINKPLANFRLHKNAQTVKSSGSTEDFRRQLTNVLEHYANSEATISTGVSARCAAEINVALASLFHRENVQWQPLMRSVKKLRVKSTVQLFKYSRIHERIGSRLLCGLLEPRPAAPKNAS